MRLKRLEIENFKGIGVRQSIELKPVTLLFGPNSAGKSSILQALHYVREILERCNPDPDQTIAGGLIDLGGFKALVHNHEFHRPIILKLVIDLSAEQGNDWLPLNSGESINDNAFKDLLVRYLVGENTGLKDHAVVKEVGLTLEVRWSDQLECPYISALSTEMDGECVASVKSPPQDGRAVITDFNFTHPLLQQIIDHDDLMDEEVVGILDEAPDEHDDDPFSSPLAAEIWELSKILASPESKNDYSTNVDDDEGGTTNFPIALDTVFGALIDLNKPLAIELVDFSEQEIRSKYVTGVSAQNFSQESSLTAMEEIAVEVSRRRGLETLLDELIAGPARIVRQFLSQMTYLGPLREIPARSYRPQLSPDESRWARGLAAWDLLHTDRSGKLMKAVNAWLGDEHRIGTEYRLEDVAFREIPVPGRMSTLFARGLTEDDLGELQDLFETLPERHDIALRDYRKGILVAPSDVGVGISQMIPVLVGCLSARIGLMAVEQPELHIHPAMQVGMGDLFIESAFEDSNSGIATRSFLIETHSEHIMLRLLRRIRETTEDDLPPGAPSMSPDDLAVIYVQSADQNVTFTELRVDKDGEFIDRWPRGFFEERSEELF